MYNSYLDLSNNKEKFSNSQSSSMDIRLHFRDIIQ